MRLIQRMVGTQTKSFDEPPFWSLDRFRIALGSSSSPDRERIENDFEGYVHGAYQASGVVFSTAAARMYLFAQARMQWLEYRKGRPGQLFSGPELDILETPWMHGTTGDLLARMDQDVSLAGNCFLTTVDDDGRTGVRSTGLGRRIVRLRPDWVTIIRGSRTTGDPRAIDAKVIGFLYEPPAQGRFTRPEPVLLLPKDVAHYAPHPDPLASHRGMSWLTPIIREIQSDRAATTHKLKFFENGATINQVVTLDKDTTPEKFDEFVARFRAQHEGVDVSYKTLFLGGGADLTPVSANMQQNDFKSVQGAGETRIAAAGGMHPVIVGLSEGLAGSSLNAGNFNAAIRLTADKTLRYLWRNAAATLETIVPPTQSNARLMYDDRDIPFLRDDEKDVAEVGQAQANTIRAYVDAGYEPDSAVDAVNTGDLTRLVHTGLFSVQLQPAGANQTPAIPGELAAGPEEVIP